MMLLLTYTLCSRFAYPVHYKWYPGDTLRYHCIYDSSSTSNWTNFGKGASNEMCILYIGYVEKIDGCKLIFNEPVHGDDILLTPTYCAAFSWLTWSEVKDDANTLIFPNSDNIRSSNKNLKVEDDIPGLCQILLDARGHFIPIHLVWRFDAPVYTLYASIVIGFVILSVLKLTEYALYRIQPGCYGEIQNSVEDKRKVTVYICSCLFYSVILVILLYEMWRATETLAEDECEFIHHEFNDDYSVDIPFGICAGGNMSVIFLFMELLYRVKVGWDLYLHHVLQTIIIFGLTLGFRGTLNAYISRISFWWLMQIATEQPIFIALLIRKLHLKIIDESNYPKMFYVAAINHYITKIITTIMVWYYYFRMVSVKDGDECSTWYLYDVSFHAVLQREEAYFDWKLFIEISVGILSPILFLLQMWQGYGYYLLGKPRKTKIKELRHQVMGTQIFPNSQQKELERVVSFDKKRPSISNVGKNSSITEGIEMEFENPFSHQQQGRLRRRSSAKSEFLQLVTDDIHPETDEEKKQETEATGDRSDGDGDAKNRRKSKDD